MKFNHLNVPSHWQNYWTRYPEGHTILEALIQWVSQVDDMVDNQNKLNANIEQFRNEIDAFVGRFDERLQDEVTNTLTDWQNSGFLDVVISSALQWQLDDYITTNEQDKLSLVTQVQKSKELLKYPNADNPLHIPTYEGGHQTVHPKVLYFDIAWNGYKYWMAHTPYPNSNDDYENPCVSVSLDGVQWFDFPGSVNPIDEPTQAQLADNYHMSDTHLVYRPDTSTLECWYRYNKNGVLDQLMRKTSTDGKTWSAREIVYEGSGTTMFLSPAIIRDGGKYKMWYVSNVGSLHVAYTESLTGTLGSWSPTTPCTLNFKNVETATPWHLDVIKDGANYYLMLNANIPNNRILLIGESTDGLNFSDIQPVLYPRKDIVTAWDNNEIYRSTLVKVGSTYRLYYSAYGNGKWYVGLLVGDTPYTLTKFDATRDMSGNSINLKSIIMNEDDKVYTQENKGSWLDNDEIKFLIFNEAGAGIKLFDNNRLRVVGDNPNQAGIMEIKGLTFIDNGVVVSDIESSVYYNKTRKTLDYYNGLRWRSLQPIVAEITASRPTTGLQLGQMMFDNTLKKPIWWDGTGWRDATGASV